MIDLASRIISYEEGTASPDEVLELFSYLMKNNIPLQGNYGRTLEDFIQRGYISDNGNIQYSFGE